MKVWIRTDDEVRGKEFCEWGADRMEDLVQALKYGGGVYVGCQGMVDKISYQFIHESYGAGAEIILHIVDWE